MYHARSGGRGVRLRKQGLTPTVGVQRTELGKSFIPSTQERAFESRLVT